MMSMLGMGGLMYIGGLVSCSMNQSHLLSMLLSVEFFMLGVLLVLAGSVGLGVLVSWCLLLFLFVIVCEGSLGVGLLISLVKEYGSDHFFVMSLLQC